MRAIWFAGILAVLAGCAAVPPSTVGGPVAPSGPVAPRVSGTGAAQNFVAVVERVEPVAERECRARTSRMNCDFIIVVDRRPGLQPNAFQTLDERGRPIVGFTLTLIEEARNQDELAFILGHEAAHHIAGHIPRAQQSALGGAILAGVLASVGGADAAGVRAAQDLGANLGARRFSKGFELEADSLGTVIAARAGYNPIRGAEYFTRSPDPGNRFLGTHPPNADRIATVRAAASQL